MVPGTAPAPTYVDDAPLFDGRPPAPPVTTADHAALAVLHAPASIASRRAALAPAVSDQEWGTGSGMVSFRLSVKRRRLADVSAC